MGKGASRNKSRKRSRKPYTNEQLLRFLAGTDKQSVSFVGDNPSDDCMTNSWGHLGGFVRTPENPEGRIPTEGVWEPFYGDGNSKKELAKIGVTGVRHQKRDFFVKVKEPSTAKMILTNPPFKKFKKVCFALKEDWKKPFIITGPPTYLTSAWFQNLFKDHLQIIIPQKRPTFTKLSTGDTKYTPPFGVIYYAYKMEFEKDMIYV